MPRSKPFQVRGRRFFFKCPYCQFRKMVTVTSNLQRKSIRCQKCSETTVCVLNRRQIARTKQSGRVLLQIGSETTEVTLFDISDYGVGFELDVRSKIRVAVGREIQLKCSWNPRLFNNVRYVVKSIRGIKIGAERRI